jgi:hypothetical protein
LSVNVQQRCLAECGGVRSARFAVSITPDSSFFSDLRGLGFERARRRAMAQTACRGGTSIAKWAGTEVALAAQESVRVILA